MSAARFAIPGFRSSPAERLEAIARMNSIIPTVEQFEHGWGLYERTQVRYMRGELPHEAPMAALEDFCAGAGLLPADVAAAAIYVRADPIVEARSGAVDMKLDYPDTYVSCILEPLEDNAIDYLPRSDEELQGELALED